jgi:protein-disulfide isomerase
MIRRWHVLLSTLLCAAVLCVSLGLLWATLRKEQLWLREGPRIQRISIADALIRGDPSSPVAIVAYLDFECPGCRAFAREVLPYLDEHYLSRSRAVFAIRHFPLPRIHPLAIKAAEAFECAGKEGRFWEMHQAMMGETAPPTLSKLLMLGERLQLRADYVKCLDGEMHTRVVRDEASARALGISITPTFFLGTLEAEQIVNVQTVFEGAKPIIEFKHVIDRLLGEQP